MQLSFQERERFYHQLGTLLHGGITLPQALHQMTERGVPGRRERTAAMAWQRALSEGSMVLPPGWRLLDTQLLRIGSAAGCLDKICFRLSGFYGLRAKSRTALWHALAYPIFMLHLGVILLALPLLFQGGDAGGGHALARAIVVPLGLIYLLTGSLFTLFLLAERQAALSSRFARFWRRVPVLGGLWSYRTTAIFCEVLGISVGAGGGILEGVKNAAEASGNAFFVERVRSDILTLRQGVSLSEALLGMLPGVADQALSTGEQVGRLDTEMLRSAEYYFDLYRQRLEVIAAWLPRLIYLLILLLLGWQIIKSMSGIYGGMQQQIDS